MINIINIKEIKLYLFSRRRKEVQDDLCDFILIQRQFMNEMLKKSVYFLLEIIDYKMYPIIFSRKNVIDTHNDVRF